MLRFDYDRLREPCLLIAGDFANLSEQVSDLQSAMLRENEIVGVMPAIVDPEADSGRFRCYLRGRQPIHRELARSGLTLERYFGILHEVTSILISSRAHMLLERNFLLEEEVIFEKAGHPQLVYLPLAVPHTEDIGAALLKLAVRWTAYLQDNSGRGVAELLALLQSPGCTAETVHKRLAQLRHDAANEQASESPHMPSVRGTWPDNQLFQQSLTAVSTDSGRTPEWTELKADASKEEALWADPERKQGSSLLSEDDSAHRQLSEEEEVFDEEEMDRFPRWKQREWWVRIALTAVTLLILWQVFWWKPSELTLYGCLGTGVAVILLLYGKLPRRKRGQPAMTEAEEEGWESFDAVLPEEAYYEQLPQQTVVLQPEGEVEQVEMKRRNDSNVVRRGNMASLSATVLLAPEEWEVSKPKLVLQQESANAEVLHTIDKTGMVLGRSRDEADVLIEEPGISSAHLEFHHVELGWTLQDLASRNGTKVNGEWLAPYTPVTLQAGDRIELPGVCLLVKDLNAG